MAFQEYMICASPTNTSKMAFYTIVKTGETCCRIDGMYTRIDINFHMHECIYGMFMHVHATCFCIEWLQRRHSIYADIQLRIICTDVHWMVKIWY